MDALIYGYSNFVAIEPEPVTTSGTSFFQPTETNATAPTRGTYTPPLVKVAPTPTPTRTSFFQPTETNATAPTRGTYTPPLVKVVPDPTPTRGAYTPPLVTPTPTPMIIGGTTYQEPIPVTAPTLFLTAENDERRPIAPIAPIPIINIISPSPYVAPTLITGSGGGGGALGGGAISTTRKPLSDNTTIAKPSFIKKNFIPLLLIASAIFVFIKKPIK
jgi:hypothetical protein